MLDFVVPVTYNVSPFLRGTLYSLLAQGGDEIFVIYNKDHAKELVPFKKEFKVEFIETDLKTVPDILNLSRDHVKSKYVSLVSQYSQFYPEKSLVQITNMEEHKCEISYCSYRVLKRALSLPKEYIYKENFPRHNNINKTAAIDKEYIDWCYSSQEIDLSDIDSFNYSGIVMLKSLFEAYQVADLDILYGFEYLVRVSRNYLISFCHNPLFVYNTGPFFYLNNEPLLSREKTRESIGKDISKIYDR